MDEKPVEVSVSVPELGSDGSWRCEVRVKNAENQELEITSGGDALEAIQQAFQFCWRVCRQRGYTQEGHVRGDSGFYRPVALHPLMHDVDKVNAAIDQACETQDRNPAKLAELRRRGDEHVRLANEAASKPR
ncbi:hypothetical protein EON77_00730 [bacterium]|nr:MAG: hypothetical protein EON77_00730 [bacterium]